MCGWAAGAGRPPEERQGTYLVGKTLMDDLETLTREMRELRQMLTWLIDEAVATHADLYFIQRDLRDVLAAVDKFTARERAETRDKDLNALLEAAYARAAKRAKKLGLDDLHAHLSE